jgi:hypothetical protein
MKAVATVLEDLREDIDKTVDRKVDHLEQRLRYLETKDRSA